MSFNTIDYTVKDRILTITLNRPEQMNAFTVEMSKDLIAAFNQASEDDAIGAIVVIGAGKAFCAGMDLSESGNVFGLNADVKPSMEDMHNRMQDPEIKDGVRDTGGMVTLAIYNCKKPVIAAINGAAVGIGATMTCAMDVRLASEKARIGFVFNKIGITPEACSSWFLPRIVGVSQALEWTYSGDIFDAQEAKESRFVKAVYPPETLLEQAYALARKFVDNRSPVAIALSRQMIWRNSAAPHPVEAHKVDSLAVYYQSIGDGKEGVQSFLEKRDPNFESKASDMPDFYPWWQDEA